MKLKTKQIIIIVISVILAVLSLLVAYLYKSGILEYEAVEMEGVTLIPLNVQIGLLCFLAVINIVNLLLCKNLIKHKKILIALDIIQLLFGAIFHIIGSIVMLVLLFIDTKDVEEKKEILKLPEIEKITTKRKWLYILVWLALFSVFYVGIIPMPFLANMPLVVRFIFVYGIQAVILVVFLREDIKRDFKVFKENFKTYMKYIFPRLGIFFIIYVIVSLIIMLITGQISTNQTQLNEFPFWLTAIMAIFFAPFIEEFLFRGMLRKSFNNDTVFIIFSSITFGLVHVLFAEENLLMYLYIIPYALIGGFLARTYSKTNNIFTNISIHAIWNAFCMIIMLITSMLTA